MSSLSLVLLLYRPLGNRHAGTASNKLWYASLSLVTLVMYSIATGGLVLMAVFYTRLEGCTQNKIFLGVNGGLCLLISAAAISPCVQDRKRPPHLLCVWTVAFGTVCSQRGMVLPVPGWAGGDSHACWGTRSPVLAGPGS